MHGMFGRSGGGMSGTMSGSPGTTGHMTFMSKSEAKKVAKRLGMSGAHSHMIDGNRVYHPGEKHHKDLNMKLKQRGMKELHDGDCCDGKHHKESKGGGGLGVGIGGGFELDNDMFEDRGMY